MPIVNPETDRFLRGGCGVAVFAESGERTSCPLVEFRRLGVMSWPSRADRQQPCPNRKKRDLHGASSGGCAARR